MIKKIILQQMCSDKKLPRIGGSALIGGVTEWPKAPNGAPLTLIMSLPSQFLNMHLRTQFPEEVYLSIFSFYSKTDYFIDRISYHGDESELRLIKSGYTRVILHKMGNEVSEGSKVTPFLVEIYDDNVQDTESYQGSKIGGIPGFLQAEHLALENLRFALQVYGADFPRPFDDVFYLSDALGYLFIDEQITLSTSSADIGIFFVQTT